MAFARPLHLALVSARRVEIGAYDATTRSFTRWASRDLAPGVFEGSGGTATVVQADRLTEAIATCAREAGNVKRVRLALEGPMLRLMTLPLGFVPERAELSLAVQTEIERYRAFAGAAAALDFAVLRQDPERLTLIYAANRQEDVTAVQAAFEEAGVGVASIEPSALSLVRALARDFEPCWDVSGEPCGIAALAGPTLEIVTWAGGRPVGWRSVEASAQAVLNEEPGALEEALFEVQRSALDSGARRWLLYGFPGGRDLASSIRPDAVVTRRALGTSGSRVEALLGLTLLEPSEIPPTLDLLPRKERAKRQFSNGQLVGVVAFGGVLAVLIAISVVMDGRVRVAHAQLDDLHAREQALQMQVAARGHGEALPGETASRITRSDATAQVFESLRDVTPADTWITEASVDVQGRVSLGGLSLARSSPAAFAQALGGRGDLTAVSLPDVHAEKVAGHAVYRFAIAADLKAVAPGAHP